MFAATLMRVVDNVDGGIAAALFTHDEHRRFVGQPRLKGADSAAQFGLRHLEAACAFAGLGQLGEQHPALLFRCIAAG